MKIELGYKIAGKKDQLIDFGSSTVTDEALLRNFLISMYKKSPTYTDRSHSHNSQKHVVEYKDIFDTVYFAISFYGDSNLIILFEYKTESSSLKISIIDKAHKKVDRDILKPSIYFKPGNSLVFIATYTMIAEITYQSAFESMNFDGLNDSERAVALCLAKTGKPLSRKDISKMLFISDRSITYAFNALNEKGLIRNTNKTNSPRLNKYTLLGK